MPLRPWWLTVRGTRIPTPVGLREVEAAALTVPDEGRRLGDVTRAMCPVVTGSDGTPVGFELVGMGGRATNGFLKHSQPLGQGVPYTADSILLLHGVSAYARALPDRGPAHLAAKAIWAPPGRGATFAHAEVHAAAATQRKAATCPTGTRLCAAGFVVVYPIHFST